MSNSAFGIIGPVMIGPSSSHTAGAVRLGLVARALLGGSEPACATLGLHGSFAATGHGHGTRLALIAGLLGMAPDDETLVESFNLARARGLDYTFEEVDLGEDFHPNGASIDLESANGERHLLLGASVGGGSISIQSVDRFHTELRGDSPTIVLWHQDRIGYLATLTTALANAQANIASIHTSRHVRGQQALTTVELDGPLPAGTQQGLQHTPQTQLVRFIDKV